ncbi:MAG TPA: SHOCT domain-containing protein [Usitatibacter sp.]|jgi:hypothetical protein|nr:SHOCT domain-containing protein [Usitatibacter sp.]
MDLLWIVIFGTSLWVYFDAKSIGTRKGDLTGLFNLGPAGWFWVSLLLWIVGFPAYLAKRGELKRAVVARQTQTASTTATEPARAAPRAKDPDQYLRELEKLGELRTKGVLTEDEFAEKKKQLLALQS